MWNRARLSSECRILILFGAFYLAAVFPFTYFRTDDWQIIANAKAHLPGDWTFAFSDQLFSRQHSQTWFFRPVFKALAFLNYRWFGLDAFKWLAEGLGLAMAGIGFACLALRELGDGRFRSLLFLVLFAASLHWHLGTLAWMGASLITGPQIFGLGLSTWAFLKALNGRSMALGVLSGAAYLLALASKESSVFHPLFLWIVCSHERVRWQNSGHLRAGLGGIVLLTLLYLGFRLNRPLNDSYLRIRLEDLPYGLLLLAGALALTTVVWAGVLEGVRRREGGRWLASLGARPAFVGFILIAFVPVLGHPFFSPNWLFHPGFFWAFLISLIPVALPAHLKRRALLWLGGSLVVVTLALTTGLALRNRWWQWQQGQRQIVRLFQEADPDQISKILVHDCAPEPRFSVNRVVGGYDHLFDLWSLLHAKPVALSLRPCEGSLQSAGRRTWRLRWNFPGFEGP